MCVYDGGARACDVIGGRVAGVGHGGGAVQRDTVRAPAGREHRRDVLYRQRGAVRHLLPHAQADDADLRRPQPPRLSHHVRRHHLPSLSRPGRCPRTTSNVISRRHVSPLLHRMRCRKHCIALRCRAVPQHGAVRHLAASYGTASSLKETFWPISIQHWPTV